MTKIQTKDKGDLSATDLRGIINASLTSQAMQDAGVSYEGPDSGSAAFDSMMGQEILIEQAGNPQITPSSVPVDEGSLSGTLGVTTPMETQSEFTTQGADETIGDFAAAQAADVPVLSPGIAYLQNWLAGMGVTEKWMLPMTGVVLGVGFVGATTLVPILVGYLRRKGLMPAALDRSVDVPYPEDQPYPHYRIG